MPDLVFAPAAFEDAGPYAALLASLEVELTHWRCVDAQGTTEAGAAIDQAWDAYLLAFVALRRDPQASETVLQQRLARCRPRLSAAARAAVLQRVRERSDAVR